MGKVKQDSYTPRSYIVETERGDVRRNRRHLAKVKTANDEQSDIEITFVLAKLFFMLDELWSYYVEIHLDTY
jgi:hypothetical protein